MLSLIKKEVNYFFSSLLGIVILVTFLVVNSLFIWAVPINNYLNVFSSGYASLEPLFTLAPWMYLILIPAMTMRTICEEKTNGTMELLMTKPITDRQLILGKFWSCIVILILTLIPTLIYVLSISYLAIPEGNVDFGATWGSYLGLILLGSAFISIGIFTSSLVENQIISLLFSIVLCIFFYLGFEWIASFGATSSEGYFIRQFGIQEHYNSISRGLVDTRDLIYYFSLVVFFIALSELKLSSRRW